MPAAAVASAPVLVPLNQNHPPTKQPKENCHDQPVLVSAPRLACRRRLQRRIGRGLTLGAGVLAPFLNLPEALLRETGLFLIAYTALVGWLGTRQSVLQALVVFVIAGNAAWTLASIALLFSGAVNPNLLGDIVVVVQAIAVGVFAELQYIGLRRSGGVVTA